MQWSRLHPGTVHHLCPMLLVWFNPFCVPQPFFKASLRVRTSNKDMNGKTFLTRTQNNVGVYNEEQASTRGTVVCFCHLKQPECPLAITHGHVCIYESSPDQYLRLTSNTRAHCSFPSARNHTNQLDSLRSRACNI